MLKNSFLIIIIASIIGFLSVFMYAQTPQPKATPTPSPTASPSIMAHKLTDKQKAELTQIMQAEQAQMVGYQNLLSQALMVDVTPQNSIQFHSAVRESQLRVINLQLKKEDWLSRARLDSGCKDCIEKDGRLESVK